MPTKKKANTRNKELHKKDIKDFHIDFQKADVVKRYLWKKIKETE